MDKLLEKKNLGIPAVLLAVFAYFLGYYISISYAGFLPAIVFAVVVFALNFDDLVKTAVKQAYIIGLIFCLINFGINVITEISKFFVKTIDLTDVFGNYNGVYNNYNNIIGYITNLFTIFINVVFAVLVIMVIVKKDLKINFLLSIIGEGAPKPQPVYQQPYQQPVPPMQQPYQQPYQQPVPPQQAPNQAAQATVICPKCQTVNRAGAAFCASCGNKLS